MLGHALRLLTYQPTTLPTYQPIYQPTNYTTKQPTKSTPQSLQMAMTNTEHGTGDHRSSAPDYISKVTKESFDLLIGPNN